MPSGMDLETALKIIIDKTSLGSVERDTKKLAETLKADMEGIGVSLSKSMAKATAQATQALGTVEEKLKAVSKSLGDSAEKRATAKGSGDVRGQFEANEEIRRFRSQGEKLARMKQELAGVLTAGLEKELSPKQVEKQVEQVFRRIEQEEHKRKGKPGAVEQALYGDTRRGRMSGIFGRVGMAYAGIPLGASGMGGVASGVTSGMGSGLGFVGGSLLGLALGGAAFAGASIFSGMSEDRRMRAGAGVLGIGGARALMDGDYSRRYALSRDEVMHWGTTSARATGTGRSADALMAMQVGLGLGGQGAALLGGLSRQGQDANAARLFGKIIGEAAAAGLEKGRYGEMLEGVTRFTASTALGAQTDTGKLSSFVSALSKTTGLDASQSFSLTGSVDALARGNARTAVGGAFSLLAAGFGDVSYTKARERQELGLFGTYGLGKNSTKEQLAYDATAGVSRFNKLKEQYTKNFGADAAYYFSQDAGISQVAGQRLFGATNLSNEALKREYDKGRPIEEQAAHAIVKAFGGADSALEEIKDALIDISKNMMPVMISSLQIIASGVRWLADLFGPSDDPMQKLGKEEVEKELFASYTRMKTNPNTMGEDPAFDARFHSLLRRALQLGIDTNAISIKVYNTSPRVNTRVEAMHTKHGSAKVSGRPVQAAGTH